MTKNSFYLPVGQGTEVSLIKWLQDAEIPIHEKMAQKDGRVLAHVPFDSNLKKSIIVIEHPELEQTVRIFVKGAPEVVIESCQFEFETQRGGRVQKQPMNDYRKDEILQTYFNTNMAALNLRAIAFSYRDMSVNEWMRLVSQIDGNFDSDQDISCLEQN
jgi:magnesium-transporting ATPase (P-type)